MVPSLHHKASPLSSSIPLPIESVISELLSGLQSHNQLILKAAPGAGKSTFFPLQLIKAGVFSRKIIMLEPRRLAARNIAGYLAQQLGEKVGERVGYRVRGETKVSRDTQLEIVTEGIMTRMLQSDPELSGIDLLIFDEFHERSIHADTSLALSLEVQEALRDDLHIVVMSATLDQTALTTLLPQAKYVESHGRSFPVEYRYHDLKPHDYLIPTIVKQIQHLMATEQGSLLVFLPGLSAIKNVAEKLGDLASDVSIFPLYGQLTFSEQQKAIAPLNGNQRKIVLATNIAETSLTIEGIRLVLDCGLERVAKFDLKTGITKLEQVRIAQSSAEQRAGRAGRLEPGICVRLYSEGHLNQQPAVPVAEIMHSDLCPLAMELAQWGAYEASELKWLDAPPDVALTQARQLLVSLELMNDQRQLTSLGKQAHQFGLEPRIASMLVKSLQGDEALFQTAIIVAALIEEPERNILDLQDSLYRLKQGSHQKARTILKRADQLAAKCQQRFSLPRVEERFVAIALSLAFPDRVAQARTIGSGKFVLANGHGAEVDQAHSLSDSEYLVAIDLMRSQHNSSRIFLAVELDIRLLQQQFPSMFVAQEVVEWNENKGRLIGEEQVKLANLVITRQPLTQLDKQKMTEALLGYVKQKGLSVLNWSQSANDLLVRIRCGAAWLPDLSWPAMDEASLLKELDVWLAPYMVGVTSLKGLKGIDLVPVLLARLGWPLSKEIDQYLPVSHQLPTGTKKRIRYEVGCEPILSVRMQEIFGEHDSPVIANGQKKIVLELLSPAQRPLQVTQNLASFWAGSYKEVQKEMKGRYPKHVWPDDPANHVATRKTKRHFNS
ncbi:ATP-dependent helicase HrpB [Vibrio genomosp. F10]|uniref:ATP-dependent helicase HrpB n=1 Tax=Vibrio genomosp. F10 TaxID=723171 RepID=A0A1B9R200_9VIBR|nr:ATP-dependent helicase HrpB [Vibrio genomosp. F10]OCH78357.1 ATP-dependent helicase HrpB [Vibrio genomosp. F10]